MWGVWVLIYFAVAIAGHAVLCRLPLRGNFVVKFLLVGGLLGVALGAHEVLSHGLAIEAWTALLLYAFACELYIFLFTLVSSSVSASLLIMLRTGSFTQMELDEHYSSTLMVDRRLDRLLATGLLGANSSGYVLTDKGRALLAVFKALKRFFRHTR